MHKTLYTIILTSSLVPIFTLSESCDPSKCLDHNFFVHNSTTCGTPRTLLNVQDTEFPCCHRSECICKTNYKIHTSTTSFKRKAISTSIINTYQFCTVIDGSLSLKNVEKFYDYEGGLLSNDGAAEYYA